MIAILKREFSSYFTSITGYIFISVMCLFGGIFLWATSLYPNNADLNGVFGNMLMIVVFLTPIITMKLISDEFRQKTDQALFTAPIRTSSIALGKYLSALLIYTIGISVILVYALTFSAFVNIDWITVTGNFIGLFIMGASLISIGMFLSSITESQVVAAISSYAVSVVIMLMDGIAGFFHDTFISKILSYLSFSRHYKSFTLGIVNIEDIIFFISITLLFIFLTTMMLEKKRWN